MSKWLSPRPVECQICHNLLGFKNTKTFVDGRLINGTWAIMCISCHRKHGTGFGIGHGQKFDYDTLEKVRG